MKKNYLLLIMAFCCLFSITQKSYGQEKLNRLEVDVYHPLNSNEIAKYNNYDFKGNFAELLVADKISNYYYLDLSKFASSFEFKYFLFLANQSGYQIQSGHGLSVDRAWFIDNKKSGEKAILLQILEMKQIVEVKDKSLTEIEKNAWIKSKNY
jgi:hypothetical protein